MASVGCIALSVIGITGISIALIKLYLKLTNAWCKSQTCLVGKTVLITGANTGIGYETALDLAKRGARIILACRDQQRADQARDRIIEETGNDNVIVKLVDLSSLQSVRTFADDINKTERQLDILVNNAGAFGLPESKSDDGLHLLMEINYFSPFLLTNLLINLLKKSAPSRIVNVSSKTAYFAKFNLDKINDNAGLLSQYYNSKLCNILFTKELAKKLEGTGVTVYSLHPGAVKTEIQRYMKGFLKFLCILMNILFRESDSGAQTTIHVAVAKGLEAHNGEHFDNCKPVTTYPTATDPGLPKKLWEKTEELVKLQPHELQF